MGYEGTAGVRLAEVIAALSLATDLGMGQPMDHALRRCLLAVRLGEVLGLNTRDLRDVYYVALVCSVGCTIKLQEFTPWFQDEIAAAAKAATVDPRRPVDAALFLLRHVGYGEPPLRRVRKVISALALGEREFHRSSVICHETCRSFGEMLGFEPGVRSALGQMHERWDGRGQPAGLRGEEQALPARIAHLAGDVEVFHRMGGLEAAVALVKRRTGKTYDPQIAQRFRQEAPRLLADIGAESIWEMVLAAEPAPQQNLDDAHLDTVARAMAYFADAKSPYTVNHSTGVAELAEGAARGLGLAEPEVVTIRRAALIHDLGRIGVPVAIWDKKGPLTETERERVRMHPYLTERVLARSTALRHLGVLAGLHHERLDGTGYHRGVTAPTLPLAARVLAAADFFHTKIEPRPHRPALSLADAADGAKREVQVGRLDRDAVDAVLGAAGQPHLPRRGMSPAGLTDREVEVLQLMARERSIREIAGILHISPKTVDHHIQHIYDKAGVSSRVAATLFAMRHNLLSDN